MTTMEKTDTTLPFTLKQERGEFAMEDTDDDTSFEDINDLLSISIPSLSAKKSCIPNDPNDEFLRLTTTVRAVYFSYLHKCLLANYILCYKEKNDDIPCEILKRCANELELLALRTSLEATIYRQNMLKLISDIKLYTSEKKAYKKLVIFLETPQSKVDIGVQTVNTWMELETVNNIQNITVSSNYEELSCTKHTPLEKEDGEGESYEVSTQSFECNNVISPVVNYISITETERDNYNSKLDEEEPNDKMVAKAEIMEGYGNIFQCAQDSSISQTVNQLVVQNEDENSQDSLLQHMEDMFCDSDDSSDLMTLIEKHSGVTKANIDKEISALLPQNSNDSSKKLESNNAAKINSRKISDTSGTGKYSFSYYKEMKSREANKSLSDVPDTLENKQKRRMSNIWFVERVYQVSKLKAKMTELSLKNYRRHGKVKEKFIQLFGESDDEEMMPDSPICIEEHLTACKERIAPWIVKRLMPFYKKRRIKDRQLFKIVAKHIADMLIIENTFPEQDCVNRYIETYFKNKKFIKTKQDVYL